MQVNVLDHDERCVTVSPESLEVPLRGTGSCTAVLDNEPVGGVTVTGEAGAERATASLTHTVADADDDSLSTVAPVTVSRSIPPPGTQAKFSGNRGQFRP